MKHAHRQREHNRVRSAFTLVEMMVVIAIIAVLVALLAGAVFYATARGPQVQARSEIGQLDAALALFKAKFGAYPPSQVKLCSSLSLYGNSQLDIDSIAFLKSMFPQMASSGVWSGAKGSVPWGNGIGADPAILSGDQCLVFFLGGIPSSTTSGNQTIYTTLGFATGNNPAAVTPTGSVIGRFYEFPSARLSPKVSLNSSGNGYLSYVDPWGAVPYAYFSSYSWKTPNSYNRGVLSYGTTSDCAGLAPYQLAAGQFYNPTSGQIVSAGPNMNFGAGGVWNSQNAQSFYPANSAGSDDLTNFYGSPMGVSGQ